MLTAAAMMDSLTGPQRLSWGNRQSSRRSTSGAGNTAVHSPEDDSARPQTASSCTQLRCSSATPNIDCKPDVDQVQRQVLRNVLSAVLQEDRLQLEHYQLTVEAVAAVLHHKISAAVNKAKVETAMAARASIQQQVSALQREAESQLTRAVQDAEARAAASTAQHTQELAALRAQLAALEKEKRHLFGKSAQKSRVVKQAETASEDAQAQMEQLRQQLSKQSKQLDAKEAALSRSKLAHHQEVAALKAALQEAEAASVAAAAQHCSSLQRLKQEHAAQQQQAADTLQKQAQSQLLQAQAAHQQQLAEHRLQAATAANSALQNLYSNCQELRQSCHALFAAVDDAVVSDLHRGTASYLYSFQSDLQQLHADMADVSSQAQQLLSLAAAKHREVQLLQHHQTAMQQQLENSRSDHSAALEQLHSSSAQLAALQPAVAKLQQEKRALGDQLAATDAAAEAATKQQECLKQQLLQATQQLKQLQQEQHECQKDLFKRHGELQALQASQAADAADHAQQMTCLQQQFQQHCDQLHHSHSQQLDQLRQRLQWLCQVYFAANAVHNHDSHSKGTFSGSIADSSSSSGSSNSCCTNSNIKEGQNSEGAVSHHASTSCASDAGTAISVLQMALEKLKQQCRPIVEDQHGGLASLYDMFQQHKQELSLCRYDQDAAAACSWVDTQQQILQLEACLLQFMLGVQEIFHGAIAASTAHQHPLQQQQQLPPQFQLTRIGTASSTMAGGDCKSACRASSLTGQLLQAMSKERKQLTQEIRKLHSQQQQARQLKHSISSPGSLASTVRPDIHFQWAMAQPLPAAMASATGAHAQQQSVTEDVDEVLQLLQSCQLPRQRPASTACQRHTSLHLQAPSTIYGSLPTRKDGMLSPPEATVQQLDSTTAVDIGRSNTKSSNNNNNSSSSVSRPSQRGIRGLTHAQPNVWAQMP